MSWRARASISMAGQAYARYLIRGVYALQVRGPSTRSPIEKRIGLLRSEVATFLDVSDFSGQVSCWSSAAGRARKRQSQKLSGWQRMWFAFHLSLQRLA